MTLGSTNSSSRVRRSSLTSMAFNTKFGADEDLGLKRMVSASSVLEKQKMEIPILRKNYSSPLISYKRDPTDGASRIAELERMLRAERKKRIAAERKIAELEINRLSPDEFEAIYTKEKKKRKAAEKKAAALANLRSSSERALEDYKEAYEKIAAEKQKAMRDRLIYEIQMKKKFNNLMKMEEARYLREITKGTVV